MSKRKTSQEKEIAWNVINSLLAGGLVLLGSICNGDLTGKSIALAAMAAGIAAITQFKNYWDTQKKEYSNTKLFSFIKI